MSPTATKCQELLPLVAIQLLRTPSGEVEPTLPCLLGQEAVDLNTDPLAHTHSSHSLLSPYGGDGDGGGGTSVLLLLLLLLLVLVPSCQVRSSRSLGRVSWKRLPLPFSWLTYLRSDRVVVARGLIFCLQTQVSRLQRHTSFFFFIALAGSVLAE